MKAVKRSAGKTYRPSYKKKTVTTDPYISRCGTQKMSICEVCRAVYMNKRWYADKKAYEQAVKRTSTIAVVCPACSKIRDDFPGGIVTLRGGFVHEHRQDIINLIKNEEQRARGFNPLERIIAVKENGSGAIIVSTTNEKLAQRIGRAVKKAFRGDVSYHWSHDNKLVRVEWVRE